MKLESHSAIASCNSHASFVLSNLPRASITPWLHAARLPFLNFEEVATGNKRILTCHFGGNRATTVIVHYAPVEGSDDSGKHYNILADTTKAIPAHNLLLLIGDCNAHIGTDDAPITYYEQTNSNGQLLLDLALETNMIITNTQFQKRRVKLWKFIANTSGFKSQIDYILIDQKWRNVRTSSS